ncbi:MAG: transglycosylase SLT domain-containing protein [Alphaproteobacteria bacterium]
MVKTIRKYGFIALALGMCLVVGSVSNAQTSSQGASRNSLGDLVVPLTVFSTQNPSSPSGVSVTVGGSGLAVSGNVTGLITNAIGSTNPEIASLLETVDELNQDLQNLLATVSVVEDIANGDLTQVIQNLGIVQLALDQLSDGGFGLNSVYAQNALLTGLSLDALTGDSAGLQSVLNAVLAGQSSGVRDYGGLLGTLGMPAVSSSDPGPCDDELRRWLSSSHGEYYGDQHSELAGCARDAANQLGINPSELMGVMMIESGGLPDRDNGIGYQGLIQFSDAAAQEVGASSNEYLASLSVCDQMPYVVEYLRQRGVEAGMTGLNVYAAIHAGRAGITERRDCCNGLSTRQIYEGKIKAFVDSFENSMDWEATPPVCRRHTQNSFPMTRQCAPAGWTPTCGGGGCRGACN